MSRRRQIKKVINLKDNENENNNLKESTMDDIMFLINMLQNKFVGTNDEKLDISVDNLIKSANIQENKEQELQSQNEKHIGDNVIKILPLNLEGNESEKLVKIAENTFQVCIESQAKLPELFYEVTSLDKNIYLEQCCLLAGEGKVLISGSIKEKLEYSSVTSMKPSVVMGDMKEVEINIPFKTYTDIYGISPIIESKNIFISIVDFDILDTKTYEHNDKSYNTANKRHIFNKVKSKCILTLSFRLLKEIESNMD